MPLPARYQEKKHPLFELIGAGLVLLQLIITLTRTYIRYDWLLDTIWLLTAATLCLLELAKDKPNTKLPAWLTDPNTSLLCGLYLVLYNFLGFFLTIGSGGFDLVIYLAGMIIYALALYYRLNENNISIKTFNWKNLLRFPHWTISLALVLCFFALFFHMSKFTGLGSYYGMQFGYSAYSGYGYNSWGYNFYNRDYIVKGYMAPWGAFAGLVMLHLAAFHILKAAGGKVFDKLKLAEKIAVPVLFAWWIFGAKGYNALAGFGTILFLIGFILLALSVYLPDKLAEWVKRKDLVK